MIAQNDPKVYGAVRAIGILRPKFQPSQGKAFIEGLDVIATAFWLKKYKLLITCAHVVESLISAPVEVIGLLVVGNRGDYKRAAVYAIDNQHDLAVLCLADVADDIINSEAADGLTLIEDQPAVGTSVSYAGFPLGAQLLNSTHAPTYAEGTVAASLRDHGLKKEIQITGPVAGGFSGSPVTIKGSKRLIGVLANSPSVEAGSVAIFMATSWQHVKAIAELAVS